MDRFAHADSLVEQSKPDPALEALLALGPPDGDAHLLWRLARASYLVGESAPAREEQQERSEKAVEYARAALVANDTIAHTHKWLAITLGRMGDFVDTKTKIQNAHTIGEHARRACELDPDDPTTQHLLGRWAYAVATVSFVERNVAALLFASPPTATLDEALRHFLRHEELLASKGGGMIRNKIFIGDCYVAMKDKDRAAMYYHAAMHMAPKTPAEELQVEAARTKHASATATGWW